MTVAPENQSATQNSILVRPADHSVAFKTKHGPMTLKFNGLWTCELYSADVKVGKGKRERTYNDFSAKFVHNKETSLFELYGMASYNKDSCIKNNILLVNDFQRGMYRSPKVKASIAHKREIYQFSKTLINSMVKHFSELRRSAHIDAGNEKIAEIKRSAEMYEGYAANCRETVKDLILKQIEEMAFLSDFK